MLVLGQSPLQPDQYRSRIRSPVLLYSTDYYNPKFYSEYLHDYDYDLLILN